MTQNWNCSKKFVGPLIIISFLICAAFLGSMYVIRPLTAGTDQSDKLQISADTSPYSLEWNRTWDIENNDKIWDMVITANSTYYLAGTSTGGTIQAWFAKFHSNGTQIWNKTWSTGAAYGLAEDRSDHCIYVCGSFPNNTCLIKYNSTGFMLWNYTFMLFQGEDIAISTSTNSISLVGWQNYSEKGYLVKLASNGSVIGGDEVGQWNSGVTIDNHDNVILVTDGIHETDIDLAVGKYASNGTQMWYHLWGRAGDEAHEWVEEVAVDSNDNIYVVGWMSLDLGHTHRALVVKFDSNGNHLWNRTWGSSFDYAYGVQVVGTAIYVAGVHDLVGDTDLLLLKYNLLGQLQWNLTWGNSPRDEAYCLSKDDQNNLYIGGWTNGTTFDALILKFKASITDGTDGIPGFQFSFALIPLVFLLGYAALRYKISFFSGKRRI